MIKTLTKERKITKAGKQYRQLLQKKKQIKTNEIIKDVTNNHYEKIGNTFTQNKNKPKRNISCANILLLY